MLNAYFVLELGIQSTWSTDFGLVGGGWCGKMRGHGGPLGLAPISHSVFPLSLRLCLCPSLLVSVSLYFSVSVFVSLSHLHFCIHFWGSLCEGVSLLPIPPSFSFSVSLLSSHPSPSLSLPASVYVCLGVSRSPPLPPGPRGPHRC